MTPQAEPKTAEFRLGFGGVVTKQAPDLLTDGQYRGGFNIVASQEGTCSSRTGDKVLGQYVGGLIPITQLRKLVISPKTDPYGDTTNLRYVSVGSNIYRTNDYTLPPGQVGSFNGATNWELASYSAGETGNPWAYIAAGPGIFATSGGAMLKDNGLAPYASLHNWGISPAFGVASWTDGGAGNLDGGASGSPASSSAYTWRYTYLAEDTGNQGNPSQVMFTNSAVTTGVPAALHLQAANVLVWGTGDPQVTTIVVYRAGGTFSDGLYRQVGTLANPGAGLFATFVDNVADGSIQFATVLETDNNPPVTSTVPSPIIGTITNFAGSVPGWSLVYVTLSAAQLNRLTLGTTVHLLGGATEDCIIQGINSSAGYISIYMQYAHNIGETVEIDAITNQACSLAIPFQDSLVLAGDPNNPHLIYKSKTGRPESFPVGVDSTGAVTQTSAGTPSNPILAMTEFRGQILCMNLSSLFEATIINGSLTPSYQVATKGILCRNGWCKTETEVWFVAYDGIWSWDGGSLKCRSQAIDTLFHGGQWNGLLPMNLTSSPNIQMAYRRGYVHVLYQDSNGNQARLMCEPMYNDRWEPFSDNGTSQVFYVEPDTKAFIVIQEDPGVVASVTAEDAVITSGGLNLTAVFWTTGLPGTTGFPMPYEMRLPWFDLGQPTRRKVFEEIFLDMDPQLWAPGTYFATPTMAVDIFVDYSDVAVDTITITAPGAGSFTGRSLVSLLPQVLNRSAGLQSFGREARAISFRIYGNAYPTQPIFYGLLFRYQDTAELTAGGYQDWMRLGHPHDKRLRQMTVYFDTQGTNRTLVLDTLTGINGNTFNEAVQTFTLSNPTILGPGRASKTFPILDGTIVKAVRVRPVGTLAGAGQSSSALFRIFDVQFEKDDYPPDVVLFTEPRDFGWPWDKVGRSLTFQIDTGGVPCQVQPVIDGSNAGVPFSVTTTLDSWQVIQAISPTFIGKLWKCTFTPGPNGKAQLFDWNLDYVREPAAVTSIDTLETDFGFPGWKFLKMAWLNYVATQPLTLTILRDGGSVFYQIVLPSQATRDLFTFYLPAVNNGVTNKSKKYRFQITSAGPFKLYADSRFDWMPCNGDQRAAFQQYSLSPEQPLATATPSAAAA